MGWPRPERRLTQGHTVSQNMLGLAPGFLDSSLDPVSWAKLTALPGAHVRGSLPKTVEGCLVLGNPLLCPRSALLDTSGVQMA